LGTPGECSEKTQLFFSAMAIPYSRFQPLHCSKQPHTEKQDLHGG